MPRSPRQLEHIEWFRNALPYINIHRGSTFVICFDGAALLETGFTDAVHDIALLSSLGIRLVLVHGARPQIDARLRAAGIESKIVDGLRVTDESSMQEIKRAVGEVRIDIEALLSHGLPNSPMSGSRLRTTSGNFVTAQPWGVHAGIDYSYTGVVRRIDAGGIRAQLDDALVVLLSPLGYSLTGEVFNLHAASLATEAAMALQADKLIFLTETAQLRDGSRRTLSQLDPGGVEKLLRGKRRLDDEIEAALQCAIRACRHGVARIHLIERRQNGALLQELFTRDGAGTLITATPQEELRAAGVDDVTGILELIAPLEESGVLVRRSREQLELEIGNFQVIELEGTIIGCAALYAWPRDKLAEVACVAIDPRYANEGRGERLLNELQSHARRAGIERLFVLTTRAAHWFREHGFSPVDIGSLPVKRRSLYNYQRNSRIFLKTIS